MHYILGTIFIFGGLALQFGGAGEPLAVEARLESGHAVLIMATGLAVIVAGGKAIH